MNAKQQVKELVKDAFPSMWLQWHFMKRPKSAERELSYLDKVIPDDAVTVDVGANCGLYTRRLTRLSRQVHAFEPSQPMARLLRRTSARNVTVHETALKDNDVISVEQFDSDRLQDAHALRADGGRKDGQFYVNNFFFFPRHLDGESILSS